MNKNPSDEKETLNDDEGDNLDEEEIEDEVDEETGDKDSEQSGSYHVGRKPLTGPPCSLKTLIDDGILEAGKGCLYVEYMGTKFTGDLLSNGNIRWQETKQIFTTPSAWVNHCRKIINPENKSGSAWSAIRYQGKRLDSYKLRWYRKQKKILCNNNKSDWEMLNEQKHDSVNESQLLEVESLLNNKSLRMFADQGNITLNDKNVIDHNELGVRSSDSGTNIMVRCVPFSSLERIQPFNITLSTNAMLLIDFHCHLTQGEVVGYLGGTWDITSHNLSILQAFPCRSRLKDKDSATLIEEEIRLALERRHLNVVGWYHSHPKSAPQPTLKDIDSQMEYQIAMKGESDSSYIPCVGLICSPFYKKNDSSASSFQIYWVMPPPEYKPMEYGKPMKMTYSISRDSFLTQDLLLEMRLLAHFYNGSTDFTLFNQDFHNKETYWNKLQISLKNKLPRDLQPVEGQSLSQSQVQQQALAHFWAFIKGLILP